MNNNNNNNTLYFLSTYSIIPTKNGQPMMVNVRSLLFFVGGNELEFPAVDCCIPDEPLKEAANNNNDDDTTTVDNTEDTLIVVIYTNISVFEIDGASLRTNPVLVCFSI